MFAAGGVVGAHWIRSPAEQAADAKAPAPTVLTVPITRTILRSVITMRGTFSQGTASTFTPTTADVGGDGTNSSSLVVTNLFIHVGQSVAIGRVMVEVSGRPVFILPGAFPMYRDITAGARGPDVRELQAALDALGFHTWDSHGVFGPSTRDALRRFYVARGYDAPTQAGQTPTLPVDTKSAAPGTVPKTATPVIYMPMSEFMFTRHLPARVAAIGGGIGATVHGPLVSLANGSIRLTGHMDTSNAGLVRIGMPVSILSEATGFVGSGSVTAAGHAADSSGTIPLTITAKSSTEWPTSELSDDVRLTITTATSSGPVLAVPVSSITTSANGQTGVTIFGRSHHPFTVPVKTGATVGGLVEIFPVVGTLELGEQVVIGRS